MERITGFAARSKEGSRSLFSTIRGSGWPRVKHHFGSGPVSEERVGILSLGHPLPRMVLNSTHPLPRGGPTVLPRDLTDATVARVPIHQTPNAQRLKGRHYLHTQRALFSLFPVET